MIRVGLYKSQRPFNLDTQNQSRKLNQDEQRNVYGNHGIRDFIHLFILWLSMKNTNHRNALAVKLIQLVCSRTRKVECEATLRIFAKSCLRTPNHSSCLFRPPRTGILLNVQQQETDLCYIQGSS